MLLQSKRLIIRDVKFSDLHNIHELHSLPQTDQFNTLGIPESIYDTEDIIAAWIREDDVRTRTSYTFCISLIETQQFIGLIALNLGKPKFHSAEVWYKVHADYWNQGYTTEALTKVLEFAFKDLKLHRVEAGCATENSASIKVLENVGMFKEGLKRKNLPIREEWKDNYIFGILIEDFLIL